MLDWREILAQHGPTAWQTVCRLVPAERAEAVFVSAMLAAHEAAHRDAVSDWPLFLEHIVSAAAISSLKQDPPASSPALPDQLRAALAKIHSEHSAIVFCLRYLGNRTFAEIAMQRRASLDSIGPTANEACTSLGRELAATADNADEATRIADELLEQAVAEMKAIPAPTLSDALLERTRAALADVHEIDFEKPAAPSRTLPLAIASALIVMIALGAAAYFKYRPKPPAMSFGQMLEAVGREHSASYYLVRNIELPDKRIRKMQAHITVLEPGRMRQVMEPPGTIVVWDQAQGKALTLDEVRQRATLREWADMFEESRPIDAVALLHSLKPGDGSPGGQTAMRGRRAQEFRVARPDNDLKIWADVESQLPIIVEVEMSKSGAPGKALMHEFVWGPPLNAAQFALEAPEGFELAAIKVNLRPATEADLVKALGVAAQLNGGKFPGHFDRAGMARLIDELRKKLPEKSSPEHRAAVEELEANLLQLGRGWMFIAESENGDDWHYAGADVLYGSDRPIFWYRPSGSKSYRIVDGSLDIRPIQPDRLPDVPAIALSSASTRPSVAPQSLPPQ